MKDKRFPTFLGVILLVVILVAGVYVSGKPTTLSSSASGSCEPINPQIANLTYGSFDFSFLTMSTSCESTLSINNKIYQDSSAVSNTHYFKITNLLPTTEYQFSLISGGVTYSPPEYKFTTTSKPNSPIPNSNLAWGRVLSQDMQPLPGAIVFLTIPGGQALSAFTNKDGNWNISFATSFNESKTDWFAPTTVVEEDLIVYSPDSKITQLVNRTDNNDPVPDIVVGQKSFPNVTVAPTLAGVSPLNSTNTSSVVSISITSPKESEIISSLMPDIFGQGPGGAILQLSLDKKPVNINVPNNNTWHWSPPQNLTPGSHELILTYQNKSVTRNFSVVLDNKLAFTATPSATLAPTAIPQPSKVPTTGPSPTRSPTAVPTKTTPTVKPSKVPTNSPTKIPTKSPTGIPTIRTSKPSTTSSLYKSGDTFPTFFLIILSSVLFSVSLYYYRR